MADTVELLLPLEPVVWLFRHDLAVLDGARVLHAPTEGVVTYPSGPTGDRPGRRAAIQKAVKGVKGPFLDEAPIISHLMGNPGGCFLLCPIEVRGQLFAVLRGPLLDILRALSEPVWVEDFYAGVEVNIGVLGHALQFDDIRILARMTRGATAWIQALVAVPSANAVVAPGNLLILRFHALAARVLALRPPTIDEINQAHDDLRREQEQRDKEQRRRLLDEYQRIQAGFSKAIAENEEAQRRLHTWEVKMSAASAAIEAFDTTHKEVRGE